MSTIILIILFAYLGIGLFFYAVTDTGRFAGAVEDKFKFIPYGTIQRYLFFFVVGLWPLWLVIKNSGSEW